MRLRLRLLLQLLVLSGITGWTSGANAGALFPLSNPDRLYGLLRFQANVQFWNRSFPTIGTQIINAVGFRIDIEPWSFLSFGPSFRGLTTFVSGTSTTNVSTSINEVGGMMTFFPLIVQGPSGMLDFRLAISAGGLVSIQRVTFTQKMIATSTVKVTFTNFVLPLEFHGEAIFAQHFVINVFAGYAFFELAQNAYFGFGLSIYL